MNKTVDFPHVLSAYGRGGKLLCLLQRGSEGIIAETRMHEKGEKRDKEESENPSQTPVLVIAIRNERSASEKVGRGGD